MKIIFVLLTLRKKIGEIEEMGKIGEILSFWTFDKGMLEGKIVKFMMLSRSTEIWKYGGGRLSYEIKF